MIRLNGMRVLLAVVLLMPAVSSVQGQSKAGYFRLMQGPVLGAVDESSALIWVRGSYSFPVTVQYSTDPDMMHEPRTATRDLSKDDDYCAVIPLENLRPDTRYYYRILIEDNPDRYLKNQMPGK